MKNPCALVLRSDAPEKIPRAEIEEFKKKHGLLGYYIKVSDMAGMEDYSAFDFVVVAHNEFDDFRRKIINTKVLVCFQMQEMIGGAEVSYDTIDALKNYFSFSSCHLEVDCAVECELAKISDRALFYKIMGKLGVGVVMTKQPDTKVSAMSLENATDHVKLQDAGSASLEKDFSSIRKKVDSLDKIIAEALMQREELVELMGELKAENNLQLFEPGRWHEIQDKIKAFALENGLDENYLSALYELIHLHALKKMLKISLEK